MILTTLSFGDNITHHYQVAFAILTYLKDENIEKICIVTDRPKFYQFFKSKIEIIAINSEIMTEWAGKYAFFWRIKMKAIESVAIKYPSSDILYVDSDTFNINGLSEIKQGLAKGKVYMHEKEALLDFSGSNTIKKMRGSLFGKTFNGITIDGSAPMWNAGVIAIGKENAMPLILKSIQLCDEICETDCPRRLVEQFAFSVVLNSTGKLIPAKSCIGHYWGNKPEWNQNIVDLMMEVVLCDLSIEEAMNLTEKVIDKNIAIIKKEKRIKDILIQFVQNKIKPKEVKYAKK